MAQPTQRDYLHYLGQPQSFVSPAFSPYPNLVDDQSLDLRSNLPTVAAAALTEAVAYFVYLGRTSRRLTAQKVLFHVTTGGTGAQTAECGIFSSPTAPNRAGQTLTKIVATGTLDALTGTGVLGNTTAFAQDVDAGTHLWYGIRTAMATNEPEITGITLDVGQGRLLTLPASGALTAATTFAGALVTSSVAWMAPYAVLTCS